MRWWPRVCVLPAVLRFLRCLHSVWDLQVTVCEHLSTQLGKDQGLQLWAGALMSVSCLPCCASCDAFTQSPR